MGDGHPLRIERVLGARNMALGQRRPEDSPYISLALGKRHQGKMGVPTSTGWAGDGFDNAMAESFFVTLECELIDRRSFRTQAQARMAIFESSKAGTTPDVGTPP